MNWQCHDYAIYERPECVSDLHVKEISAPLDHNGPTFADGATPGMLPFDTNNPMSSGVSSITWPPFDEQWKCVKPEPQA